MTEAPPNPPAPSPAPTPPDPNLLATLQADIALLRAENEKTERERKEAQRRADRLDQELRSMRRTPVNVGPPLTNPQAQAAAQVQAQLAAELEAEKQRLMRLLQLDDEDIPDGFQPATMGELQNSLQLAKTQKELRQLGASKAERDVEMDRLRAEKDAALRGELPEGAAGGRSRGSGGLFDNGGPAGLEAEQSRLAKLDRMRARAAELGKGNDNDRLQAGYLTLRASHVDSRKIVRGAAIEEELPNV